MKAVYYYSAQQEQIASMLAICQIASRSKIYEHHTPTIGGMKYTEICHFEDDDYIPPKNKWADSRIITIRYGLDAVIDPLGRRYAKLT